MKNCNAKDIIGNLQDLFLANNVPNICIILLRKFSSDDHLELQTVSLPHCLSSTIRVNV